MANPSSEEEGILREWAPLTDFLEQIPLKAQKGIFTHDLSLTCVDTLPEFIAVGTNLGLIYWYDRRKNDLQRLRCENTTSSITCVKVISTVDYMVAAGNEEGIVTVFQIPKIPPDSIPESMKPKKNKQVERYTISGLHSSPVTAIEWSMNGMKLFSGDRNGLVVLTEIDFYMHLSKSMELLNEKYEIVQLSYSQQLLLVSTVYRSIVCHKDERWRVAQVGQKERKTLGKLGAIFCLGSGRPKDVLVYSSRPGLRIWLADKTGFVQQTLIYKDALMSSHPTAPLINPAPVHLRQPRVDPQFGPLLPFKENLLVTYNNDVVYILNPATITVVATVADLRKVQGVAVNKEEIFILEGDRSLIRVAYMPELTTLTHGSKPDTRPDSMFMSIPVSLSDSTVASSLMDLTSKIKDSAIVPAIPFHKIGTKINIFGKVGNENDGTNSHTIPNTWNRVVTADEALELPPIVPIPAESVIDLSVEKLLSPGMDCLTTSYDDSKVCKEVYNHSQRSSTGFPTGSLPQDSVRTEVLDKIGVQQYEDILFKPKHKRRKSRSALMKPLISETESGSDTLSVSSVRSVTSEGEDPWSSERLDVSSDWSNVSTRTSLSINNEQQAKRSLSEETLVKLGDCDAPTLPDNHNDIAVINQKISPVIAKESAPQIENKRKYPEELCLISRSNIVESNVPPSILPDLRSPSSIERDVATKEHILAKVLNLEPLCLGNKVVNGSKILNVETVGETQMCQKKVTEHLTQAGYTLSEELTHALQIEDAKSEELENECTAREDSLHSRNSYNIPEPVDEKLSSLSSILSYGPPSGSSAPPSNHASLEMQDTSTMAEMSAAIEKADRWMQYKVPDSVTSLAACHSYVCCVDPRGTVHYSGLSGLGLKWQKVDYKAKHVAVSQNSQLVWKINHKNVAYALMNPSPKGPFGDEWLEAAKNVQCISVNNNIAWFVSLDSRVYVQKHLSKKQPCCTSFPIHCPWPVMAVYSWGGNVLALTSTAEVLYRDGITSTTQEGKQWIHIKCPSSMVANIALTLPNTAWVVDTKNVIHFSNNFTAAEPQWWQVLISDYIFQHTTSLQQFRSKLTENYLRQQPIAKIACGESAVWIVDKLATSIHMNKTEFTGHQWSKVPVKYLLPSVTWHFISAEGIFEDKGQLWMISSSGDFFCSNPNKKNFHALPLPSNSSVVCLAVTSDVVWLLFDTGKIYIRQGISDTCLDGVTWNQLNMDQLSGVCLTHISCGCDVVWACDDQGDVFMTVGSPHFMASTTFSSVWILVDEKPQRKIYFSKVFVGPQTFMVWAIDNKKNVYVREGIFHDFQVGTGWVLVSGIQADELSISSTAVWAVSPGGSVYRRYGITQNNFIGDYWKKIPGVVSSVTASMNDALWALDKNFALLSHKQCQMKLCNSNSGSSIAETQLVAEGDWEVV